MTIMLPGRQVSKAGYIVRALIAIALVLGFALWMITRSTGVLERNPNVHAAVPVDAGLITTGAPVRFNGVKVGQIRSIDAGTTSSQVNLEIGKDLIGSIPADAVIRVLPRTFFGDIYIQFVSDESVAAAGALSNGDEVHVDNGPDAINLYDLFTKLSDLLAEVEPEKMNIALAAVDRAIGDNGDQVGIMIDDWWQASQELEGTLDRFIEATPKFRAVAESLRRATPDIIDTLESSVNISRGILQEQENLSAFFTAASGYLDSVSPFVAEQRRNLITIVDSTSTILSTVADNPSGISQTLTEADRFGAAGTMVFASGRFNITAVPTFSEPMPYTAADCPTYGSLRGTQCFGTGSPIGVGPVREQGESNGPIIKPPRGSQAAVAPAAHVGPAVINGAAEAKALAELESVITGTESQKTQAGPSAPTVLMVGPMVRGTEVTLS